MSCRRFLSVLLLVLPFMAAGQGVRTVVIDPGHGGKQPGTVWGSIYEKDIVLDISLILGEMMKKEMPGVKVIFTRTTDVLVDLSKRAKIANDAKADLFVSIHVNASPAKEGPSGALTLVMGGDKEKGNLDMAMRENDAIFDEEDYATTYKEYLSGSTEMFILYSVMQYANIEKSIRFAGAVQKHFKSSTPMPDRGIQRHNALVLWQATMPGVLVETGFMNNTHDRRVLTSDDGKRKVAAAILAAIKDYHAIHNTDGGAERAAERKPAADEPAAPPAKEAKPKAKAERKADRAAVKAETVPDPKPRAETKPEPARTEKAHVVQILSATRKVPSGDRELKGFKPIERYGGGRYRYYLGPYASKAEAERCLPEIRRSFGDAFITTIEIEKEPDK